MWVSDISDNSEQSRCPLHASDQRYVIDWFWPMAFMKNFVWIFFFFKYLDEPRQIKSCFPKKSVSIGIPFLKFKEYIVIKINMLFF